MPKALLITRAETEAEFLAAESGEHHLIRLPAPPQVRAAYNFAALGARLEVNVGGMFRWDRGSLKALFRSNAFPEVREEAEYVLARMEHAAQAGFECLLHVSRRNENTDIHQHGQEALAITLCGREGTDDTRDTTRIYSPYDIEENGDSPHAGDIACLLRAERMEAIRLSPFTWHSGPGTPLFCDGPRVAIIGFRKSRALSGPPLWD